MLHMNEMRLAISLKNLNCFPARYERVDEPIRDYLKIVQKLAMLFEKIMKFCHFPSKLYKSVVYALQYSIYHGWFFIIKKVGSYLQPCIYTFVLIYNNLMQLDYWKGSAAHYSRLPTHSCFDSLLTCTFKILPVWFYFSHKISSYAIVQCM